jgi:hypothetical protein
MSNKLFTIPRNDLRLEFFRAGGNGGQKQNKTSSACRITHIPSGAVGLSRDMRQQSQNRKLALERLVETKEFKDFIRLEVARLFSATELREQDCMVEDAAGGCTKNEVYCDLK